jgi:hypothetical protein
VARNLAASAEGKAALLAAGGAEAVVGAMRAHVGVAAVQDQGIMALYNMTVFTDEGKAALRAAGGHEAAKNAARNHPSNASIQEWSAKLIKYG